MPGSVAPVADEREGLMAYLEHQAHVLRVAAYGLTDEQARAAPMALSSLPEGVVGTDRTRSKPLCATAPTGVRLPE